jgi:hypothetical protein
MIQACLLVLRVILRSHSFLGKVDLGISDIQLVFPFQVLQSSDGCSPRASRKKSSLSFVLLKNYLILLTDL